MTNAEESAYVKYYYKQIENALSELGTIKQLNYKSNGNKMVQVLIKEKLTKDEIRKIGTKLSKEFSVEIKHFDFSLKIEVFE